MLSYWWSPRLAFLIGTFMLTSLLAYQLFKKPFLSSFSISSGDVIKHEVKIVGPMRDERILFLWLGDTVSQPYTTKYRQPQKNIVDNISFIKKYGAKIWHDKKGGIKQLQSNKSIIVDYDWFWWPSLFFYIIPALLHFGIFQTVKNFSTNINSYSDMWRYTIGEFDIISNNNYRKERSGGLLPYILQSTINLSKKRREFIFDEELISWRQFFNICNAHCMTAPVREWMSINEKGIEFMQGFNFYEQLVNSSNPSVKLSKTTDSIFEFVSLRIDSGRKHYEEFGKVFRSEFPQEYFKLLKELDKLR